MSDKTVKYLISTFLCSWILWGIVVTAGELGITELTLKKPIGILLYVFGGLSPAICELVIQKRSCSNEEFKKFLKSIVNMKQSISMYLYAIGGAILVQSIPVLIGHTSMSPSFYMGFVLILPMTIGGGLEEIGWRGLLQPELEKNLSHFTATLVVGVIWAVWHLPLWFIDGTNQQSLNFLWFCINALMLSFFIGSVRYISGSIFLSILAHATINAFWEIMPETNMIFLSLIQLCLVGGGSLSIDYKVDKKRRREQQAS